MSSPLLAMPNLAAQSALKAAKEVSAPSNTTFGRSTTESDSTIRGARRTKHRAVRIANLITTALLLSTHGTKQLFVAMLVLWKEEPSHS